MQRRPAELSAIPDQLWKWRVLRESQWPSFLYFDRFYLSCLILRFANPWRRVTCEAIQRASEGFETTKPPLRTSLSSRFRYYSSPPSTTARTSDVTKLLRGYFFVHVCDFSRLVHGRGEPASGNHRALQKADHIGFVPKWTRLRCRSVGRRCLFSQQIP